MTSLLSVPSSITASGAADEAAEAIASALEEITKENKEVYDVAGLIFVYFFITLGASVLLMGLMTGIERSKTGLELSDKIRLGASAVVGTTIALLAALDTGRHGKGGFASFVYSPWVLPTGMLGLLVVVVLYNVKLPGSPASVRRAFRRPLWKVKVRRGRRSF